MGDGQPDDKQHGALKRYENWDPKAKPETARIIHDGYAAVVKFDTGIEIDFPSDFVLHVCEPSFAHRKSNSSTLWTVGQRVRKIREWRGLPLDARADKCGIAK